ncbi:MAG: flagellar hook-length control protein FliK, partial [Oscillospiraceae bacterium]
SKNENDFNQTSESKEQKLIKADDKEVSSEILQKPLQMIQITDNSTKLDKPVHASPNVQVAEAIKTNLSEGKKEFEIQLMPENLGKISVKLVLENGALSVEMKAVNPKTQSLLAENSAEIKSILENASLKAVDVPQQQTPQDYVQQQNKNQQQQNQQQQQKNNQEKNDTSTIDFISMIQQIKNKSIMA